MDIPASRLILYKRAGRMLHNIESFYASIGTSGQVLVTANEKSY